jgi:DNA-binding transcriptional regulator YdaS (Cro superfamily)
MNEIHPLDKPGVRAAIADAVGVSPQAISNWKQRGVPIEYCATIEKASKGAATRQELRPNDWQAIWPELAKKHKAAANA